METTTEDVSSETLKRFLIEQQSLLDSDKRCLQEKEGLKLQDLIKSQGRKFHSHNSVRNEAFSFEATVPCNNQANHKGMVREKSSGYLLSTPREKDKEQLINLLGVPKTRHSYPNIKSMNKEEYHFKEKNHFFTNDSREKEKDRLAAIFATSSNTFLEKPSYEVSKNLNSNLYCEKSELLNLKENKCSKENKLQINATQDLRNDKKTVHPVVISGGGAATNHNCNPKILISDNFEEPRSIKSNSAVNNNTMVRIGEFSPHNPNLWAGKPVLGIGEYEERRKKLLDQQKQEYNDYLHQASEQCRSQSPFRKHSDYNNQLRSVATQTDWENETPLIIDAKRSPICSSSSLWQEENQNCQSSSSNSPIPKCLEGLSEKEVKEFLYREELRKQIEEKNRIKAEQRKKEEEEEAKLEAKIQKDQEEMRRQFEAERIQRLELAIRKKEQDDLLRQRLAAEQQKALEENKAKRKQLLQEKVSSNSKSSQRFMKSNNTLPLSKSMPATFAAKSLSDVREGLKEPLLEVVGQEPNQHNSLEVKVPLEKISALEDKKLSTTSPPTRRANKVDMLAQKAVFDPLIKKSVSQQTHNESLPYLPHTVNDKMEEVDKLLKAPLLPETPQILPPVSPPLLYATIPPITSSFHPSVSPPSPPVPASRVPRTNHELLEDKWKVPYVERYNVAPANVFTKHNHSVLTQLGAFRRQLQQERLRMQQRVQDESP